MIWVPVPSCHGVAMSLASRHPAPPRQAPWFAAVLFESSLLLGASSFSFLPSPPPLLTLLPLSLTGYAVSASGVGEHRLRDSPDLCPLLLSAGGERPRVGPPVHADMSRSAGR
jgi:hypothetical protein